MKKKYTPYIFCLLLTTIAVAFSACSTQKNTAKSRWWHAFNARYNTYYNGKLAYIDASLEKENGNKDNFTEMIPLYTVGNKASRELGKGNFDRAIEKAQKTIARHSIKRKPEWNKSRRKTEKDIEWLSRREYNPFLWKAWMLMGRSQFHKGAFDEAAATFAYMARMYKTQPAIYGKARAWLAKCYIEQDWLYDAEDVIRNMQRDSIDWRAVKEWDYTYADYYIHTGDFEKAIPYLRKVIKHEMRKKQKAREWYLMGQLLAALGRKDEAYKAFRRVVAQNPPYELEFNARIAMTEVMAAGKSKQMISRLRRMAASDKNKDYLDQVYYAMGNIYLAGKDTTKAIEAYEKGNTKATRSGVEKGVLLLHLGDLYWQLEKYSDARRCYGEAIGLLDKDRKDYEALSNRSKVLDKLVPYTDAIHLQDSLQYLAQCPEAERNAAIDRVIEALKKKEKEERDRQAEQEAAQRQAEGQNMDNNRNRNPQANQNNNRESTWYFYNVQAVQQGKSAFERLWGKRENADDWQRNNKTVVGNIGSNANAEELTDEQRDSIFAAEQAQDSLQQIADSAQNDPHKREYYLAQIPFTPDQLEASNLILEDALHHAGVIFKDELDNLPLSEKHLRRLSDHYPNYEHIDETYYHLYLLYSRLNQPATADAYVDSLKVRFPESQWTMVLTDPYFKENAQFGKQLEDSLYAATYEAFKQNRFDEVAGNARVSETRFPLGANRDKFLFISGLSKLNDGDADGCVANMKQVVEKYPRSRISEMAGMIVNGVNQGRQLHGGKFDLGDIWTRRSSVLNDSDSIKQVKFTPERDIDFVFMLVYNPDSLNENKLLFEMARFNFTNFLVRNFEIQIEELDGMKQMRITGFRRFEEAYEYARQLFGSEAILRQTHGKAVPIIISQKNEELIGKPFTYKDYEDFYAANFNKVELPKRNSLYEPADLSEPREPERIQPIGIPEVDNPPVESEDGEDTNLLEPEDDGLIVPIEQPAPQPTDSVANDSISPAEMPSEVQPNVGENVVTPEVSQPTPPQNNEENAVVPDEPKPVQPTENGTEDNLIPDDSQVEQPQTEDEGGVTIPLEQPSEQPANEESTGNTILLDPQEKPSSPTETPRTEEDEGGLTIPDEPEQPAKVTEQLTTTANQPQKNGTPEAQKPQNQQAEQPQKPQQTTPPPANKQEEPQPEKPTEDEPEFFFEGETPAEPTEDNPNDTLDDGIEDEYYELDGF